MNLKLNFQISTPINLDIAERRLITKFIDNKSFWNINR